MNQLWKCFKIVTNTSSYFHLVLWHDMIQPSFSFQLRYFNLKRYVRVRYARLIHRKLHFSLSWTINLSKITCTDWNWMTNLIQVNHKFSIHLPFALEFRSLHCCDDLLLLIETWELELRNREEDVDYARSNIRATSIFFTFMTSKLDIKLWFRAISTFNVKIKERNQIENKKQLFIFLICHNFFLKVKTTTCRSIFVSVYHHIFRTFPRQYKFNLFNRNRTSKREYRMTMQCLDLNFTICIFIHSTNESWSLFVVSNCNSNANVYHCISDSTASVSEKSYTETLEISLKWFESSCYTVLKS